STRTDLIVHSVMANLVATGTENAFLDQFVNSLKVKNVDLTDQLDTLTKAKDRTDRANSRLIDQGLADLNQGAQEQADLINQLKGVKRNNTRLRGANQRQAEDYTNQVQEIADQLGNTNRTLSAQINSLQTELGEKDNAITDLDKKINDLENQTPQTVISTQTEK